MPTSLFSRGAPERSLIWDGVKILSVWKPRDASQTFDDVAASLCTCRPSRVPLHVGLGARRALHDLYLGAARTGIRLHLIGRERIVQFGNISLEPR